MGIRTQLLKSIAGIRRTIGMRRGAGYIEKLLFPKNGRRAYHIQQQLPYDKGLQIHVDTHSHIEWNIFMSGYYESGNVALFESLVHTGDVVIDIGANIGAHTLVFRRIVGSSGQVVAVEPYHVVFQKLRDNLALNAFQDVVTLPVGVSDEVGMTTLFSVDTALANEGSITMWPEEDSVQVSDQVPITTIDMIVQEHQLERVDFIKIDIEGNEYQALLGAVDTITRFKPYVLFEYRQDTWNHGTEEAISFEQATYYFRDAGYTLHLVDRYGKTTADFIIPTEVVTLNFLAIPPQ